MKKREIYFVRI